MGTEQTILILAPLANDAKLTATILRKASFEAVPCVDSSDLVAQAAAGCGAWLIAEEALDRAGVDRLSSVLAAQPSWSDVPILIITAGGAESSPERQRRVTSFGPMGNVTLIERPFRPSTLVSSLDVALRSRARQYQVRNLLAQADADRQRLEFVLQAGRLGAWTLDLHSRRLSCSATCKANYGQPAEAPFTYEDLEALIHGDDREDWRRCITDTVATGNDYFCEYRIMTPAGETRWIQVQGLLALDVAGEPHHLSGVTQDITARKQSDASLREAKEAAERASRTKDNFLAQLSHELRTPLMPVLMVTGALRDDDSIPPEIREQLGMIARNVALEARLIDDLLDLTRITRGKLSLRMESCDAHSLIGMAIEIVRDEAREKQVDLRLVLSAECTQLTGDPARLQQALWNLLRNAVKFTPRGGHVLVRSHDCREGGCICIQVSDDGIGFDPHEAEGLFEPFQQVVTGRGGLGLGLAIAKAVVGLHQGCIRGESAGPGRGATFIIELPAKAPSASDPVLCPTDRKGQRDGVLLPEPSMRLLVVEDHPETLRVVSRLLTVAGHEVTSAKSLAEAREAARGAAFDAVISDLGLPDGTGNELMAGLRADFGLRGIALSGYGMDDDVRRSREAGFVAHLVKPVDIHELRHALRRLASGLKKDGAKRRP